MSLETLSRDIIGQAQINKEKLLTKTNTIIEELELDSLKRIESFKKEKEYLLSKEYSLKKSLYSSKNHAEIKSEELEIKSEIFKKIKKEVYSLFLSYTIDQKRIFYSNIYKQAKELITGKVLLCNQQDKNLFSLLDTSLEIKEDNSILFGGILVSKDSKQRVDFQLKTIVEDHFNTSKIGNL